MWYTTAVEVDSTCYFDTPTLCRCLDEQFVIFISKLSVGLFLSSISTHKSTATTHASNIGNCASYPHSTTYYTVPIEELSSFKSAWYVNFNLFFPQMPPSPPCCPCVLLMGFVCRPWVSLISTLSHLYRHLHRYLSFQRHFIENLFYIQIF